MIILCSYCNFSPEHHLEFLGNSMNRKYINSTTTYKKIKGECGQISMDDLLWVMGLWDHG